MHIKCMLCGHEFKDHQQTEMLALWFCDVDSCNCSEFVPDLSTEYSPINHYNVNDFYKLN